MWLGDARRRLQETLENDQRGKVLKEAGLPLYLKLAFQEARWWRSFDPVGECFLSDDLPGIIDQLFTRLSEPGNHGQIIVRHALGFLTAARYGLTEDEMLSLLAASDVVWKDFEETKKHDLPQRMLSEAGRQERQLPVIVWSRLYLDLEPYLTERAAPGGTTVAFYHRTIEEHFSRFLLAGTPGRFWHASLAHYFAAQPVWPDGRRVLANQRKLSELPYQLKSGELWDNFEETVTDVEFLHAKVISGLGWDLVKDYSFYQQRHSPRAPLIAELSRLLAVRIGWLSRRPDSFLTEIVTEITTESPVSKAFLQKTADILAEAGRPFLIKVVGGPAFRAGTTYTSPINCSISPDGQFLAIADRACRLSLLNADTGGVLWSDALPGRALLVWFTQSEPPVISVVCQYGIRTYGTDGTVLTALGGSNMEGYSSAARVRLLSPEKVATLSEWIHMNAGSEAEMEPWDVWDLAAGIHSRVGRDQIPAEDWRADSERNRSLT